MRPGGVQVSTLDHRIPPPLVGLACGLLAWLMARASPGLGVDWLPRVPVAAALVALGLSLDVWGLVAFRRARTTLNPLSPERTSAVVQGGPYRFTRNPMYLGMACVLLGACAWLANPLALLAVFVFVGYITRFQIMPEERALLGKFGGAYADYLRRVRRWL